jgi:hypothetical protein
LTVNATNSLRLFGRNGGPELAIIRKYPTDGSEVSRDTGMGCGPVRKPPGDLLKDSTIAEIR